MKENKRLLPGSMSDEEALLCDDPITALIARMSVSKFHEELAEFVNAEIQRPGAKIDTITIGMAAYMLQIHASFAAYFLEAELVDQVVAQFQAVFAKTYRQHFIDSAKAVAA